MDFVTLALAKKYTDEKVAEGGGVNIDLDKYGIGSALLGLFAQGGGTTTIENVDGDENTTNFWDKASSNPAADTVLLMSLEGITLFIRGVTKSVTADAQCVSLSFSVLLSSGGTSYILNVQIVRVDAGATLVLKLS